MASSDALRRDALCLRASFSEDLPPCLRLKAIRFKYRIGVLIIRLRLDMNSIAGDDNHTPPVRDLGRPTGASSLRR